MFYTKTSGVPSSWPGPALSTCWVIASLTIWALLINSDLHAESFDVGSNGELILHVDVQLDAVGEEKCGDRDCPSDMEGFRVADLSFRYNHFRSINTTFFGEVSLDYSEDITTGFTTLDPEIESVVWELDPSSDGMLDDDTLEVAVLGVRKGPSEFRLGRQKPSSDRFSPSQMSYLNFSLSAFDDDRVLGTDFRYGDMVSVATLVQNLSAFVFLGLEQSDGSAPEMNYELSIESRIKEMKNALITLATRSVDWGSDRDSFKAHGIKLYIFQNNGNAYTGAISANDLGQYFEFVFSRDWAYRHRVSLGFSNFNSDPNTDFQRLDSSPGTSRFFFVNYAYAISQYLKTFAELGTFHEGEEDSHNLALGLRYFF